METLNEKHGRELYSHAVYRIWSELHVNGMHTDLDKPPNNSMFKRAGSSTPTTTKNKQSGSESVSPEVAQALTQAATQVSSAIVTAFTPQSASSGRSTSQTGNSPAKVIENRSKCYRQLTDLQNLRSQGLLSDEDYFREKDAIMGILKKLI